MRRRADQVGCMLLVAGLVLGLVLTLTHAGQDVYNIPGYGVGMALGAFVVAAAGAWLGWRSGSSGRVALTMLAVVVAIAGLVSFGILLLAVLLAFVALAARASRGERNRAASAAGGLLGLGVFVLALTALSPPLVDCATGSAGENVFLGLESDSASGSASAAVSADSRTTTSRGHAEGETYGYSYTCRDGKLVHFALRHR